MAGRAPGDPERDFVTLRAERMDLAQAKATFKRACAHAGPQGPDLRPRLQHAVRGGGLPLRPDRPRRRRRRRARPVHLAVGGSRSTTSTIATAPCIRATRSRRVLPALVDNPNVGSISILAHSMGNYLTVETLRQMAIRDRGLPRRSATSCWPRPTSTSTSSAARSPRSTPSRARPSSLCSSRATTRRSASRASSPATRPGSARSIRPRSPIIRCSSRRGCNVVDLTSVQSNDFTNHSKFATSEVVAAIGDRLAQGQTLTDAKPGLVEAFGAFTKGAVSIAADVAVGADQTRRSDPQREVGRHRRRGHQTRPVTPRKGSRPGRDGATYRRARHFETLPKSRRGACYKGHGPSTTG